MASGAQGKNILLFSDGTGNSSGKLFKTNVWRMYEAVDLGLAKPTERVQIAYYDNGVGTSKIKAVAWVAGIFGFGLQRNVRAIYKYVCRNYRPRDKIYCFGFSRGAYTIRIVAALLARYGIVTYSSENELEARTRDVMRAYQSENKPNLFPGPIFVGITRTVRDFLVATKRSLQGYEIRTDFGGIDIEFIGVWDTVSAYGGPSVEITRAIDNFIYPLSMTDQCLSPRVQSARHALSLDDERDAFRPLLWNEWDWAEKARKKHPDKPRAQARFKSRLQQVWFAGVHSDVGGGYPDESLSYVSLAWMMQEVAAARVRLLPELRDHVFHMSNSLGPIHNSRGGLASYYRYQPRRIEGFFHKKVVGTEEFEETLTYRDPVKGERKYPPLGDLTSCKVHESVVARIARGTDDYAPIVLPPEFQVVPFNFNGGGGNPRLPPLITKRLSKRKARWAENRERIYDWVWFRRIAYFVTVGFTAALVLMPLYAQSEAFPDTTDGQWIFGRLTSGAKILPWFLQPWVRAFHSSPLLFIGLATFTAIGAGVGTYFERSIRSKMHGLWEKRTRGRKLDVVKQWPVQQFRNSFLYQVTIQTIKWYVLPIIVGILMLLGIGYLIWTIAVQVRLSWNDPQLCQRVASDPIDLPGEGEAKDTFSAGAMCNQTGMAVRLGQPYAIELAVPTESDGNGGVRPNWSDGSHHATPQGFPAKEFRFGIGYLGAPLRRLVDVDYMQVIYQIRPKNRAEGRHLPVIVHALDFTLVDKSRPQCWIYRADFVARAQGELFLFANDSVGLFKLDGFYTSASHGNRGTGVVYVHELHTLGASPARSAALGADPCRLGASKAKP